MELLIKISQFVLSFSLLVIIHEFGHFLFARLFGTRVEKFYLFFDPWFSLFKFKKGGTEYGIGWIPFGGYVKISGMIDESMDTEQMKQPVQPYEFRAKPAWQRLLIMVGGVLMNILLAVCIYIGISYKWGETYLANEDVPYGYVFNDLGHEIGFRDGDRILDIAGVPPTDALRIQADIVFNQAEYVTVERDGRNVRVDIPEDAVARMLNTPGLAVVRLPYVVARTEKGLGAEEAGLKPGDRLVSLNGEPMEYCDQYIRELPRHKGETVTLGISRDSAGVIRTMSLPVHVSDEGLIGIYGKNEGQLLTFSRRTYGFWQAIPAGIARTGEEIGSYAKQIKLLFTPKTEAYKSLGGVLTLGSVFPTYWSWQAFWQITAFFSIVLAIMNILPIPALDGGHVLFLLVEVITRRKPSDKFMERAQSIGIVIVLALILFANGNDIYRFFIK